MIETDVQIHTADGIPDAVFFSPDASRRWPGVLHLTDIGGIRPAYREMARRLAAEGYAVLVPNVFYRTGKPPMLDFKPVMGEERTMKRFAELSGPLTPDAMEQDCSTYLDYLSANHSVAQGPIGVVGYCFTGSMALRAAAARPDKVSAAASFHGGGLYTDAATSPHRVLPRVRAQLYFGHAVQDRSMPQEAIEKLDRALEAWGGQYESEVYTDALHSWTTLDSAVYNQPQADRAFAKLIELLARTLN